MPDSLISIGKFAFSNTGLHWVIIPETTEIIEDYAFELCRGLKAVVASPKRISYLKKNIFCECYSAVLLDRDNEEDMKCAIDCGIPEKVLKKGIKRMNSF